MTVTTTEIFAFMKADPTLIIDRREIYSGAFEAFRKPMRRIIFRLAETTEERALEIALSLRTIISEWLTVPMVFDPGATAPLRSGMQDTGLLDGHWGEDIRTLARDAVGALNSLESSANPLIASLLDSVEAHREQRLRVFCHRRARARFESLLHIPLDAYLHNVRDYALCSPFDILVKVGPLKARGWGAVPDAIVTAPRYKRLIQIVWAGCADDEDFGYDPVRAATTSFAPDTGLPPIGVSKHTTVVRDERDSIVLDVEDEMTLFRSLGRPELNKAATLVQIDNEHGLLYRPHAEILSFDPNSAADTPIGLRTPNGTLAVGMFVILDYVNADLGGVRAEHGHYSRIWKAKLKEAVTISSRNLVERLREAGLDLLYLEAAVRNWCKEPTTVIHAPQQELHFEILMAVLQLTSYTDPLVGKSQVSWWRHAWIEIKRSRGEAIQAGFVEQGLIEEQLLETLRHATTELRQRAEGHAAFSYLLASNTGLTGHLLFYPVQGIEVGFRAPEVELRIVRELSEIDRWQN